MGVNPKDVGNLIDQKMREKGYTDQTLSKKLGLTPQSVYKWRHGKCLPDIDNMVLLSQIFGISIDELIKGKDLIDDRTDP